MSTHIYIHYVRIMCGTHAVKMSRGHAVKMSSVKMSALYMCVPISLSLSLSVCPSVRLSVCPSVRLSLHSCDPCARAIFRELEELAREARQQCARSEARQSLPRELRARLAKSARLRNRGSQGFGSARLPDVYWGGSSYGEIRIRIKQERGQPSCARPVLFSVVLGRKLGRGSG